MPATFTLASTTLVNGITKDDNFIVLASTSGVQVGNYLYITDGAETLNPGEVVKVFGFGAASGSIQCGRGRSGTAAMLHSSTAVVWIAMPDQLYEYDPIGAPPLAVYVQPWINVLTGGIFWPYGDETDTPAARWWQKQTVTHSIGALGVRTSVTVGPQS